MRCSIAAAACLAFASAPGTLAQAWDYSHPEQWPFNFPACGGQQQSPVDLRSTDAVASSASFMHLNVPRGPLANLPVALAADSKAVFIDMAPRNITATLSTYPHQWSLARVSYHLPSEHTLDGARYAAERQIEFVVSDGESNRVLIVSELYRAGPDDDAMLSHLLDESGPTDPGFRSFYPSFDFHTDPFLVYEGSLTTPPCSEVVNWHVSAVPHFASAAQLRRLSEVIAAQPASGDVAVLGNTPVSYGNVSCVVCLAQLHSHPHPHTAIPNGMPRTNSRPTQRDTNQCRVSGACLLDNLRKKTYFGPRSQ